MATELGQNDPYDSQTARWARLNADSQAANSSNILYHPLETSHSMRLLKVELGESHYNLSFTLFPMTIEMAQDCYHALSYTWGSTGDEAAITINKK